MLVSSLPLRCLRLTPTWYSDCCCLRIPTGLFWGFFQLLSLLSKILTRTSLRCWFLLHPRGPPFSSQGLLNLISPLHAPDVKKKKTERERERWLAVIQFKNVPEEIPRRVLLLDCVSVP